MKIFVAGEEELQFQAQVQGRRRYWCRTVDSDPLRAFVAQKDGHYELVEELDVSGAPANSNAYSRQGEDLRECRVRFKGGFYSVR